jgi:predicted Zn-dependent protease
MLARAAAVFAALLSFTAGPVGARAIIRDAEIERTIAMLSRPVFEAAGVAPDTVKTLVMLDPAINAFVGGGGRTMVLNTGLIQRLDDPGALVGVIAHETGHITGGHLARRAVTASELSGPALLATVIAAAAAAAAGSPEAGAALAMGGGSAAQRAMLAFSRAEEAAADQAGVEYMNRARIDPAGMLGVLRLFKGQEVFASRRIDPYALTHPLSSERIALLERRIAESPAKGVPFDPELAYWHARMRAKLDGFVDRPERTLNLLEDDPDRDGELGLYRRAIALHRLADTQAALATLDRLDRLRPDDPFYLALRGQILFEAARPAEAVAPYRRALALAPDEPLIAGALGRALLASGAPGAEAEALRILERAVRDDPGEPGVLRDLATAYARGGQDGMAALVTSERLALVGEFRDAGRLAQRAMDLLPRGSPGWIRAEDVAAAAEFSLN